MLWHRLCTAQQRSRICSRLYIRPEILSNFCTSSYISQDEVENLAYFARYCLAELPQSLFSSQ
jgi:hypothetical protein